MINRIHQNRLRSTRTLALQQAFREEDRSDAQEDSGHRTTRERISYLSDAQSKLRMVLDPKICQVQKKFREGIKKIRHVLVTSSSNTSTILMPTEPERNPEANSIGVLGSVLMYTSKESTPEYQEAMTRLMLGFYKYVETYLKKRYERLPESVIEKEAQKGLDYFLKWIKKGRLDRNDEKQIQAAKAFREKNYDPNHRAADGYVRSCANNRIKDWIKSREGRAASKTNNIDDHETIPASAQSVGLQDLDVCWRRVKTKLEKKFRGSDWELFLAFIEKKLLEDTDLIYALQSLLNANSDLFLFSIEKESLEDSDLMPELPGTLENLDVANENPCSSGCKKESVQTEKKLGQKDYISELMELLRSAKLERESKGDLFHEALHYFELCGAGFRTNVCYVLVAQEKNLKVKRIRNAVSLIRGQLNPQFVHDCIHNQRDTL
jgi:hypothetical protein